ncbi:hypothetical protein Scep_014039 [Stephania cephalantha]|uniref:Uncharacterized protein n=1 Tax=Stephania cephalantha TaxID=152367 RepID=A0AAP0J2C1_9MAGN
MAEAEQVRTAVGCTAAAADVQRRQWMRQTNRDAGVVQASQQTRQKNKEERPAIRALIPYGKSECSWESFQAYKHLKSLGYIVSRHRVPWTSKIDKSSANLTSLDATSENSDILEPEISMGSVSTPMTPPTKVSPLLDSTNQVCLISTVRHAFA